MKGLLPLAIAITVVSFIYVELSLNFTFHWATSGDLGNGLSLPASFHFAIPAAFVSWGLFFLLGGDGAAARGVAIASFFGCLTALLMMVFVAATAGLPDFWAISLGVAVAGGVLVVLGGLGAWYVIPATFPAFACCVFWWIATGLDGWAEKGGGVGNSVQALAKPATAGAGAFGGVISTPYGWVAFNVFVTLLVGCLLGLVSSRLASVLTPKPATTPASDSPAR
ncbi:MAG TPA: hypothetical protein VF257_11960 [Solirubrobacteraceae bacterium]